MTRLVADRERCIGSGMCALIAPEVFDQDEGDGRVRLLDPSPSGGLTVVREAVDACPAKALDISD
ncbi:ferredoxin [Nocardia suismassiliense]|uniref:ferredoxin n=1 Tax=Nocardia suismassiliense TaxID=2077092 RepID=UPI000D1D64B3|nr:ferredoxin [Nocardia suismassiliense]